MKKKTIRSVLVFGICLCIISSIERKSRDDVDTYLIYESSKSPNQKYGIETRVYKGKMPDIYIDGIQKTRNEYGIEYTPCINDNGVYAYALYDDSVVKSSVYIDKFEIYRGGIIEIWKLTDKKCFFSEYDLNTNIGRLWVYDLDVKSLEEVISSENNCIKQVSFKKNGEILIEKYNINTGRTTISKLKDGTETEILNDLSEIWMEESGDIYRISGNDNGKYIFNALYQYYEVQEHNPFSLGNDFAGRITWTMADRLNGLVELYEKTKSENVKSSIVSVCENLCSVTNDNLNIVGDDICDELWSSSKYSLDKKTPRTDLVAAGQILYPLLKAANLGILDENMEKRIIEMGESAFGWFEKEWCCGHYSWRYESEYIFDGIELPWNQQNIWGVALIELWKATGDIKYYQRCREMMECFKEEWEYIAEDERMIWHYWPVSFYEGWKKEEMRSANTPKREAAQDILYEDTSHAAINAKFVKEYYINFGDDVVTEKDLMSIENNMKSFCYENGFLTNIGYNERETSYVNIPGYWFVEYENPILSKWYSYFGKSVYPDFEWQVLYGYAWLYDESASIDLTITKYEVMDDKVFKIDETEVISTQELFGLYEKEYFK